MDGSLDGDLVLELSSGERVRTFGVLLKLASPVLKSVLSAQPTRASMTETRTLTVEGSKQAWDLLLSLLHPSFPRPQLTLETSYLVLPVAQRYKVLCVLAEIHTFLLEQFPEAFSSDPNSSCCVFRWLKLADEFQLHDLKKLCMRKIRDMAGHRQLERALIANVPEERVQGPCKPPRCPGAGSLVLHSSVEERGHRHCPAWCKDCRAWRCYRNKICSSCHRTLHRPAPVVARWFPSSPQPQLLGSIKSLSRDTLEELLACVVVGYEGHCSEAEHVS